MIEIDWYCIAQKQQQLWNPQTLTVQQIKIFIEGDVLSVAQMKDCVEKVLKEYHYSDDDLIKFDAVVKYFIDQISENIYPAFEERSMMKLKNKARTTTRCIKQARWLFDAARMRHDHVVDIPRFLKQG